MPFGFLGQVPVMHCTSHLILLTKTKRLSKILKTTDNFSFMKMHIKREWTFGNRPNIRRRGYEEELRLGFLRALNSCCCSSFGIHLKSAGEQSKLLSIICLKSACEATIIISVVFFLTQAPLNMEAGSEKCCLLLQNLERNI